MQFEWDEAKNFENIRKHEIDFADVPAIFDSEMLIELDDRFDYGEDRSFGIGFLGSGIAVVVWTERQKNTIRIMHEEPTAMSKNDLKSTSRTNWAALESRSEDNIDYSDIPPLTDEFFERATLRISANQAQNLVLLDPDVRQWFQSQGDQYKILVNKVLRQYIESSRTQHQA
jgi:uncharacterized DUF497 family protein